MSTPKRQRTIVATIKDPESDLVMIPTIVITRRSVRLKTRLIIGSDMAEYDIEAALGRMCVRAVQLGRLLQLRWWGTA